MNRPITIFTGQWADLPFDVLCEKLVKFGYDGVEPCCWGDHFDVVAAATNPDYVKQWRARLDSFGLKVFSISNHLVGQAICDRIDERHRALVTPEVWGDGDPEGVRQRAAENMKMAARAAKALGVDVVNGFTGSPIWHLLYSFPAVPPHMIDDGYKEFAARFLPILDEFQRCGVKFALEVHPTEIAFDFVTCEKALQALDYHPCFGFNYDPSHLAYQGVDYVRFLYHFRDRIFHAHMKDVWWNPTAGVSGVFGGHLEFGDMRRYWNFRSLGHGRVDFEEILRALNDIDYQGPLSVEWEDSGMDREHGAAEACAFLKKKDFPPSTIRFDAAFEKE
ncbi:MAG: sugar phosphate isomerase/epimerase [Candidatus Sumerlaeales bacterium]|nr:sugar phosphate isomerase/epimerase [Candidatus Sumerlaeales bacterium]